MGTGTPMGCRDSLFVIRDSTRTGFSLVEVVVGVAILFIAVTGLVSAYNFFIKAGLRTLGTIQATYILEEGVEAANVLRDYGWTPNIAGLTAGMKYYFEWNGVRWVSTTTPLVVDSAYARYFTIENVARDTNDNIAPSGTYDPGTKKFTVLVSWQEGATTTSRSLSTYMTNLFSN